MDNTTLEAKIAAAARLTPEQDQHGNVAKLLAQAIKQNRSPITAAPATKTDEVTSRELYARHMKNLGANHG